MEVFFPQKNSVLRKTHDATKLKNHVSFYIFFVWYIHAENGNSMNSTHSMNDVIINEFIKIPKMASPYPFTSMSYPKLNS